MYISSFSKTVTPAIRVAHPPLRSAPPSWPGAGKEKALLAPGSLFGASGADAEWFQFNVSYAYDDQLFETLARVIDVA